MSDADDKVPDLPAGRAFEPAAPLWQLAPTRGADGRCLADFMMLIPGLGRRPAPGQRQIAAAIREVCASYGDRVVFADINYAINVVWISVAAEPGLGGQIARAIRQRVPEALLIGGQLGTAGLPQGGPRPRHGLWRRLRGLARPSRRALGTPDS